MSIERATLVKFRSGDPAAFAEVVRELDSLVRKTVAQFWKGAFDREEAMQEVWVHAFRQRESFDLAQQNAFPGWLAVLARRKCLDLLRLPSHTYASSKAEEEAALAELEVPAEQQLAAEARDIQRAVDGFRAQLRPGWREFFDLHFVQGLDYEQVIERLHVSRLRCKYLKKVLAAQARRDEGLRSALGRFARGGSSAP